jgi:hypothetical protein
MMYETNRGIKKWKKIEETQIRTMYHLDKSKAPLPPNYTLIFVGSMRSFLLYPFFHSANEVTSATRAMWIQHKLRT